MTPELDNVIQFHDPKEDAAYGHLYQMFLDVINEAYNERGKIDDENFDIIAFQTAAELLGYLEGRLIRRGHDATVLDRVRQSRADAGLCTEIEKHREECQIPNCQAPAWFAKARKRYAKAVAQVEAGPRATLWARIKGWILSVGWRRRK
jgi:hypothetical protein